GLDRRRGELAVRGELLGILDALVADDPVGFGHSFSSLKKSGCIRAAGIGDQFKFAVDLDGDAARQRDMADGGARVLAELLAPELEEQVRGAVDDLRLLVE